MASNGGTFAFGIIAIIAAALIFVPAFSGVKETVINTTKTVFQFLPGVDPPTTQDPNTTSASFKLQIKADPGNWNCMNGSDIVSFVIDGVEINKTLSDAGGSGDKRTWTDNSFTAAIGSGVVISVNVTAGTGPNTTWTEAYFMTGEGVTFKVDDKEVC